METVSIIVPVYRVEPYLERCVRSLTGQTYGQLDILLIDDASPDGSGALADRLAQEDGRIRVFHQPENRGVSAARNLGLEKADGEWICFCDGDDWYDADFVQKMLACAAREDADFVVCDYKIVSEHGPAVVSGCVSPLNSGCPAGLAIALGPISSCLHMIRRSLFVKAGVRFPVQCRQYEELPVIPVLAKYASSIAVLHEALYYYYQRGDGTSASNNNASAEGQFRQAWELMRAALGSEYGREAEYHAAYALLYGGVLDMCKAGAPGRAIRERIRSFEAEFPDCWRNPYLARTGRAKRLFLSLARGRCIAALRLLAWVHGRIVG